jgi:hypothetical protein
VGYAAPPVTQSDKKLLNKIRSFCVWAAAYLFLKYIFLLFKSVLLFSKIYSILSKFEKFGNMLEGIEITSDLPRDRLTGQGFPKIYGKFFSFRKIEYNMHRSNFISLV